MVDPKWRRNPPSWSIGARYAVTQSRCKLPVATAKNPGKCTRYTMVGARIATPDPYRGQQSRMALDEDYMAVAVSPFVTVCPSAESL